MVIVKIKTKRHAKLINISCMSLNLTFVEIHYIFQTVGSSIVVADTEIERHGHTQRKSETYLHLAIHGFGKVADKPLGSLAQT